MRRETPNVGPSVVDLFAGAGGLSSGFENAGCRVTGALDFWEPACESLRANHPDAHIECGDVKTLDETKFRRALPGRPDIVLGGPSCQGFSTSGGFSRNGRQLHDERNSLFQDFVRFVEELSPPWVVMENVPGLLLFHRGQVAKAIIHEFRRIGYYVVPIILLAADYGVPQLRRRLFFVGNRSGAKVPLPLPTHGDPELWKDFALPFEHLSRIGNKSVTGELRPHVTFGEACGDLPPVQPGERTDVGPYPAPSVSDFQRYARSGSRRLTLHSAFDLSPFDRAAIPSIRPGQNWTSLPPQLRRGRFARIRRYDATTLLRRLEWGRPAYTINTKFNDATTGAYIHPEQDRTITLREAARLQSFKDRYAFSGTPADVRKQIGNAVPPLLAQRVGEAIQTAITGGSTSATDRVTWVDPTVDVDQLIGLKPLEASRLVPQQNRRLTEDA